MVASVTMNLTNRAIDAPPVVLDANTQVDRYRIFMFAAAQYMQTYSAGAATLTWDTIKTNNAVPPASRNVGMPLDWKIVAAADNSWVACTPMDARAIGIAQQLVIQGGLSLNTTQLNGNPYVVVGSASDIGKASSCQ